LTGTTLSDARATVEHVRTALSLKQVSADQPQLTVTFSAGLAIIMFTEFLARCIERAGATEPKCIAALPFQTPTPRCRNPPAGILRVRNFANFGLICRRPSAKWRDTQ